jgi:hypothetical protein
MPRQQEVSGGVGKLPRELVARQTAPIVLGRLVGIGDQHVDPAATRDCVTDGALDRLFVHVIENDRLMGAALNGGKLSRHFRRPLGRTARDHHAATRFGQCPGQRLSQMAAPARNQRYAAAQIEQLLDARLVELLRVHTPLATTDERIECEQNAPTRFGDPSLH